MVGIIFLVDKRKGTLLFPYRRFPMALKQRERVAFYATRSLLISGSSYSDSAADSAADSAD